MKKAVLILFAALLVICGCSKDDNDHNQSQKESEKDSQETLIEEMSEDVKDYIENHKDVTYEQIQQLLAKEHPDVTSVIEGNMMYITTEDGYELQIDLYGVTRLEESDQQPISEDEINKITDDIEKVLEIKQEESSPSLQAQNSAKRAIHLNDANNDKVITTPKPRILFWAPEGDKTPSYSEILKVLSTIGKKYQVTPRIGTGCTIESMKEFSLYDVVILACHGNERGEICLPGTDYWLEQYKNGKVHGRLLTPDYYTNAAGQQEMSLSYKADFVFNESDLRAYLPNMKNTLLWTIMCYAGCPNSTLLSVAADKGVMAFTGADRPTGGIYPINFFSEFAAVFFNNGNGGAYLHQVFNNEKWPHYRNYDYLNPKTKRMENVTYGLYCPQNVVYKRPSAGEPSNNKPRAHQYNPYGTTGYRMPTSNVQVKSLESVEEGFQFKNMKTDKVTECPFTKQILSNSWKSTYENLIDHYLLEYNIENLEEGEYEYRTYLKVNGQTIYSNESYKFTKKKKENPLCPDNNHPHAIDMGAAGVWACCNVGASKPEEYGSYFAWGETEPKSDYSLGSYKYWTDSNDNGSVEHSELTNIGSDIGGNVTYDAATKNWGSTWRLPSCSQMEKLIKNCKSEWTQINGVDGRLFISVSNDNNVFLPAAGRRFNTSFQLVGGNGEYWSSSLTTSSPGYAYFMGFTSSNVSLYERTRYWGLPVRPVRQ